MHFLSFIPENEDGFRETPFADKRHFTTLNFFEMITLPDS
jgi:hypothetical protein